MIEEVVVRSQVSSMELGVSVSGMTISIAGGPFQVGEKAGTLDEVEHTVVSDDTHEISVIAYLVELIEDGSIDVLVDEYSVGLGDDRYRFDEDSPYRMLDRIFHVVVPAGATDLGEHKVTAWRVVKTEAPKPKRLIRSGREPNPPPAPEGEPEPEGGE